MGHVRLLCCLAALQTLAEDEPGSPRAFDWGRVLRYAAIAGAIGAFVGLERFRARHLKDKDARPEQPARGREPEPDEAPRTKCPACGAAITPEHARCPDCDIALL